MIEVDAESLLQYFSDAGREYWHGLGLTANELEETRVSELAWGVSNIVLRVDAPGLSFVVKQSREKLRTAIDWFSQLERVWRETAVLEILDRLLPSGVVPQLLFQDRENYLFGMQAVESDHLVWKSELLAGRIDDRVAQPLAQHLALVHAFDVESQMDQLDGLKLLADRTIFDELRLDPFYRYMADNIPSLRDELLDLINTSLEFRPLTLVLADFSPKNILLTSNGPVLVDFETGHLGDPAFDIGFFLSHLLLKAVMFGWGEAATTSSAADLDGAQVSKTIFVMAERFWSDYSQAIRPRVTWFKDASSTSVSTSDCPPFERQCVRHFAACMLSRVDGKSRVDYLSSDRQKQVVRRLGHQLLKEECSTVPGAFQLLQ